MIIVSSGASHPKTGEPYFPSFGKHKGEWGFFWATEIGEVDSKIKGFSFSKFISWLKLQRWEEFYEDTARCKDMDQARHYMRKCGDSEVQDQYEEIMRLYFES